MGAGHPASGRSRRSQCTVVKQMTLCAISESKSKLWRCSKFFGQLKRYPERIAYRIIIQTLQDLFAIPDLVLERARRSAPPDGIPVFVLTPILVTPVVIEQEIVDILGEIDVALEPLQLSRFREAAE